MKLVRARNDRILRWSPIFDLSVCVCVGQSVVPNLGESERFALRTRLSKFLSTGRRGYEVTVPLLALLRSESRRQRAPRPAAARGPTDARHSRHARSRSHHGHRAATVTPESLQAAGKLPCATTLSLSTPPSSRDGGVE